MVTPVCSHWPGSFPAKTPVVFDINEANSAFESLEVDYFAKTGAFLTMDSTDLPNFGREPEPTPNSTPQPPLSQKRNAAPGTPYPALPASTRLNPACSALAVE